ncbi:hypothetical protein AB0I00_09665, partial [Streptomyces sp. NPDC050803]|uniref:endonuclease toxin domain-containing protein n=1 Tax=unclassified Streptomyces TaxID=2593676 RepID=UPI00342EE389
QTFMIMVAVPMPAPAPIAADQHGRQNYSCRVSQPYDPQSLSSYSYSGNDPINYSDPSGFIRVEADGEECSGGWDECGPGVITPNTESDTSTSNTGDGSDNASPGPVDCADYGYMVKDACAGAVGKVEGVVDTSNLNTASAAQIPDLVQCDNGDWVCKLRNSLYRTAVASGMLGGSYGFYGLAAKSGGPRVTEKSVWSMPPSPRGFKIEEMLGGNLPNNFRTIDKWDKGAGVATSIKSIDTSLPSYSTASGIRATGRKYVRAMARFNGASGGGVTIAQSEIKMRRLEIGVPRNGLTDSQEGALLDVVKYGRQQGVVVEVMRFD